MRMSNSVTPATLREFRATDSNPRSEAQRELSRRELARRDLLRFGQYMIRNFKIYEHQKLINEKLNGVIEYVESRGQRGIGRLMIETQPQVGKSLIASNLFPAWALGNHPDWRFILTSYNDSRAQGNSKMVRDLVNDPKYRAVFGDLSTQGEPVKLSSDSRSVSEWSLASPHRGGVFSAGVGGGITGRSANVVLIDDPFKSREDAESSSRRDLVDDWYQSQIYTRQQEGMAIILFHTRWHPDDLAGRMIRNMATNEAMDRWEVLCMPALALAEEDYPVDEDEQIRLMGDGVFIPLKDELGRQPGEALCAEMLSKERLENIRDNMSAYNWMALYQQMPFTRSGGKFKREWFKIEDRLGADVEIKKAVWYWDQASRSQAGDYSAGVLMGLDQDARVWVLMVARGQWSTYERRNEIKKAYLGAAAMFGARVPVAQLWHQQDPGGAGLDSARDTNKALAGLPAHFEPVSGDKETRADPWSSALEADNVRILKGNWNQVFVEEHLSFPNGRNDDQVDAASSAYVKLVNDLETGMAAFARRKLDQIRSGSPHASTDAGVSLPRRSSNGR